jgi:hypothetical protein
MAVFADHQDGDQVRLEPRGFLITPVFPGGAFHADGWREIIKAATEDFNLDYLAPVISAHAHPNIRTTRDPKRGRVMQFSETDLWNNFVRRKKDPGSGKWRAYLAGMHTAMLVQADNLPREELVVRIIMLQVSTRLTASAFAQHIQELRGRAVSQSYQEVGFRTFMGQLSLAGEGQHFSLTPSGEFEELLLQPDQAYLGEYLTDLQDTIEITKLCRDQRTVEAAKNIVRKLRNGQELTIQQEAIDAHMDLLAEVKQQLISSMVKRGCYLLTTALFRLGLRGDIVNEFGREIADYALAGRCRPNFSVKINGRLYRFWSLRNPLMRRIERAGIADKIWQGDGAFAQTSCYAGGERAFLTAIRDVAYRPGKGKITEFSLVRGPGARLYRFLPREAVRI